MYRFLLAPRWIGLGVLMTLAAAAMVGLGFWQLDRYYTRSEINNRIDSATERPATPLTTALAAPSPARPGVVGPVPSADLSWTMVTVTGRYDTEHEILARSRSVNSDVGFEVITPLVLADGTAVLVDRGWIAATDRGAAQPPDVPPAPTGEVTVVGRIHAPETRADQPEAFGNAQSVRHIAPQQIAAAVPFPLYGAYVTLEKQTPPIDPAFVAVPPAHQDAAMNAGYVAQWWLFAVMTMVGFGYLARREARNPSDDDGAGADRARERGGPEDGRADNRAGNDSDAINGTAGIAEPDGIRGGQAGARAGRRTGSQRTDKATGRPRRGSDRLGDDDLDRDLVSSADRRLDRVATADAAAESASPRP